MTESLAATAVLRVSLGSFEPDRFDDVDAMSKRVSEYLIPAIERLPGLIHWYSAVLPAGSYANVSVWDSDGHAAQMNDLKEMTIIAREEAEAAGVKFTQPIRNYPIGWTI
jgi:hypothetical protein